MNYWVIQVLIDTSSKACVKEKHLFRSDARNSTNRQIMFCTFEQGKGIWSTSYFATKADAQEIYNDLDDNFDLSEWDAEYRGCFYSEKELLDVAQCDEEKERIKRFKSIDNKDWLSVQNAAADIFGSIAEFNQLIKRADDKRSLKEDRKSNAIKAIGIISACVVILTGLCFLITRFK